MVDELPLVVVDELPLVVVVVDELPLVVVVEVEVEPDDEPELLPEELVVVLISTLPPEELPPPKKPPKKPPPKPPPPQPPPITTGCPPPATTRGCCGSSGSGIGIRAVCSQQSSCSSITRRMRLIFLGTTRLAGRSLMYFTGAAPLVLYSTVVACGSATCTAPPAASAPPAATAANFARAIRTDMVLLSLALWRPDRPGAPPFGHRAACLRQQ